MAQTKVQLLQPDLGDVIDFDSSTLFMDGADNRVGIRNTNPQYELDVTGTINATNFRGNISVGTIDDWITHTGDTDTKIGFSAADTFEIHTGGGPRVVVASSGNVQVNGGAVHIDANGELAVFETDTNLAFTNSGKLAFDYSGNIARIRSSHNGSGTTRNLGLYIGNSQKILITSTEITAAVQLNLESAGSYIKSNQLKFNPSGHAYIDHGVVAKDIYFRLSKSSTLDQTMLQMDADGEITKFHKVISVGLQGGNDTAVVGGGSGIGAYLQLNHASSGINTKLMGNADSYLNQFHGNLAIGEDAPDGNKLLIRAATTVGTTKGHIMLTGDGATNGEGPQIVFSESGSGSNFAGAYVGHIREGSNSTGSLVFGTRATGGDINTVPTERIRIWSTGQILYQASSGDNTFISKRTNAASSNGNYFFHMKAQDNNGNNVGEFGFHRDTAVDDAYFTVKTRNTGGSSQDRLRIFSTGKLAVGTTSAGYGQWSFVNIGSSGADAAGGETGLTIRSDEGFTNTDVTGSDNWTLKLRNNAYSGGGVTGNQGTVSKILFSGVTSNGHNSFVNIGCDTRGTGGSKGDFFIVTGGGNEALRIQADGQKIVKNGRLNINSTFIDFSGSISTPSTAAAIYRPADNSLAVSTANVERLLINNSGLTLNGGKIYGDDGATNTLDIRSTSGNSNHSAIQIGAIQSSDNGGIHFYTAGTSTSTRQMTLKGTTGYLGIGVNNPIMPLDVDNKSNGTTEANKRIVGFYKSSASSATDKEGYIHLGSWSGHYGVKLGYCNEGASPGYHNSGFFISTVNSNQDITNHTKKLEVLSTGTVKLNRDLVITGNRSAGVSSRYCIQTFYKNIPSGQSATFKFEGMTTGWADVNMGGYASQGQAAFHYAVKMGGYMTQTYTWGWNVQAEWTRNTTITDTQNSNNFTVVIDNNATSQPMIVMVGTQSSVEAFTCTIT